MQKFQTFFIDKKIKSAQFVIFCINAAYALVMLITGFNFLAVVSMAFAMIFAIWTFIQIVFRNYVNVWTIFSYVTSVGFLGLLFLIRGADTFINRLWYHSIFLIIPIGIAVLIYFMPKFVNLTKIRLIAAVCSVVMFASSLIYFFTVAIWLKPTAVDMQEGHDDYLNSVNPTATKKPNVLFVLMDDMAYSDLSLYSYLGSDNATIKTPNIDSIATDGGVYFDNFYASSPVCSPSRFGILTGRYSARGHLDNVVFPTAVSLDPFGASRYVNPFQFTNNVDGILGDEITIAEVLKSAGYSTALIGKWNLGDYGEYLPTNQGFDYFFGSHYVNDMTPYNIVRETNGEFTEVYSHYDMLDQSETTDILTEELNSYISNSIDNNDPFFAYYCTPWPHYPIFSGEKGDTTDDSYIDCIEEFDTYLGTTLQLLKDKGVYDDTIIIFTSDNGPGREGVTGALRGRKNTTYDGGQKVPMLVRYPSGGVGQGAYLNTTNCINSSCTNLDIFPTLLDYLGIALPTDRVIDGKSMVELLSGNVPTDTRIHDAIYYLKRGKVQSIQMPVDNGGIVYDYKYYESVRTENSAFIDQVYKNYLFNLDVDPAEGYNVSMKYSEIAQKLNEQLHAFREELIDNRRGKK